MWKRKNKEKEEEDGRVWREGKVEKRRRKKEVGGKMVKDEEEQEEKEEKKEKGEKGKWEASAVPASYSSGIILCVRSWSSGVNPRDGGGCREAWTGTVISS